MRDDGAIAAFNTEQSVVICIKDDHIPVFSCHQPGGRALPGARIFLPDGGIDQHCSVRILDNPGGQTKRIMFCKYVGCDFLHSHLQSGEL